MSELVRIKYKTEVVISTEDLIKRHDDFEGEIVLPDFEDEIDEAEWRYEQENEEKEKLEFAEAFKEIGEKDNAQILTYTFNKDVIRLERKMYSSEGEFILINPKTSLMSRFYFYKGEPNVDRMFLHHDLDEWEVNNKIIIDKKDIKKILGYDCYKMVIEHKAVNEKKGWVNDDTYKLYVTDELDLPVPLLINIWQPVTDVCALEIKHEKTPNTYQIERAFEIEKGISLNEVRLPKKYRFLKADES